MEEYEKYHSTLPSEDLIELAYFERGKVRKRARKSAKKILDSRNIPINKIEEIKEQIRKRKLLESRSKLKGKNNGYGIWDFLLDMIFYS